MTFLSRKKRPITPHARTRSARTAISLAAGWLLGSGAAQAQFPDIADLNQPAAPIPLVAPAYVAPALPTLPAVGEDRRYHTVTYTRPPTAMQTQVEALGLQQLPAGGIKLAAPGEGDGFNIRVELPGPDRLFRRESESQLFDTIRQEAQVRPGATRVIFPDSPPLTRDKYAARNFKQMVNAIEPSYVVHRRLLFEQKNFDRNGWEIGALQPAISTGKFLYDVVALPYHSWTRPWQPWDSSAGKCLPGDETPLLRYREEFSVTGLVAQAGGVAIGLVTFP